MSRTLHPAVFLDRDDTLIANAELPDEAFAGRWGDLADPAHVALLPGVHDSCLALRRAGFALVVITNQGSVARGGATIAEVEATNARVAELLPDPDRPDRPGSSLIERTYFCPYHPLGVVEPFNVEHPWRKPQPGMILAAVDDLCLDLASSWMVGDAERDIEAGRRAGIEPARCIRVGVDGELPDLAAATARILRSR
ncbi:MAG: HAD-IIIA family hydrolase [Planctomycetota bacterium]|nr:HAD-IIIA family hydrolase [Planctomycetota bacterium]